MAFCQHLCTFALLYQHFLPYRCLYLSPLLPYAKALTFVPFPAPRIFKHIFACQSQQKPYWRCNGTVPSLLLPMAF
jgi:hypothetical protein